MDIQSILKVVEPVAASAALSGIAYVGIALGRYLTSPSGEALAHGLAVKAAAETESLIAAADNTHNTLLTLAVHQAMAYAETHQSDLLKTFDSKAQYVVNAIQNDPRFAHLNIPAAQILHLIETVWINYFSQLGNTITNAAVKAPAAEAPVPTPVPVAAAK